MPKERRIFVVVGMEGRFRGATPFAAAKKAATRLHLREKTWTTFVLRETTPGKDRWKSGKLKVWKYKARLIPVNVRATKGKADTRSGFHTVTFTKMVEIKAVKKGR